MKLPHLLLSLITIVSSLPVYAVNPATSTKEVASGLAQLATQTRTGLTNADAHFAAAIINNPTNNEALVLKTASELALLQGSPAFVQILSTVGVTNPSLNLYTLDSDSYGSASDQYGYPALKGNMTNIISYIDTTLRPQISTAISQLSKVSTNVNFTLTQRETASVPVTIDYGDVQMVLCALYLAQAASYIGDTYNLNILLSEFAKFFNGEITLHELLPNYPQLLTFSSNNQRSAALQAFSKANTAFQASYKFMVLHRVVNTRYPYLFPIEIQDQQTKASFLATADRFKSLAASISSPQTFPKDTYDPTILDGSTVFLGSWLTSPSSPHSWIGTNSFWGDLYNPGTLLSTTFAGIFPQMTDAKLSAALRSSGLVHQVTTGAGITANSSNGKYFTSQPKGWPGFCTEGSYLAGNYRVGGGGPYGSSSCYGFLWDGKSYTPIQYPKAQNTTIIGITNGIAWGGYVKGSLCGGFLYDAKNNKFTTISFPGSPYSSIQFISGNYLAGNYSKIIKGQKYNGAFFYDGANYHDLTINGASYIWINGMNGSNVWGSYYNQTGSHPFFYNGSSIVNIAYPKAVSSTIYYASGGRVLGYYYNNSSSGYFFYSNGIYSNINLNYFGHSNIQLSYSSGTIFTGGYLDNRASQFGLVYDGKNFISVNYPGSSSTYVSGGSGTTYWGSFTSWSSSKNTISSGLFIDRNGSFTKIPINLGDSFSYNIFDVFGSSMLGAYQKDSVWTEFFYNGTSVVSIDYPGALAHSTHPESLGRNWLTGYYDDRFGNYNSFAYWIGSGSPPKK